MNNSLPPYGDPNQWSGQMAQGPVEPQQPGAGPTPYGAYPPSGSYPPVTAQPGYAPSQGWPQQTWQPQPRQPQEPYPQQVWQPYGQQEVQPGYPQGDPQQPYPQGNPQQPYPQGNPPQGYPQGNPQPAYPQNYPQAGVNPGYSQGYPPQGYPQGNQAGPSGYQTGSVPPAYPSFAQNGQPPQQGYAPPAQVAGQFFPAQGYSGYVTRPGDGQTGMTVSSELVMKVVLFGLLPVLFLVCVFTRIPAMGWIFLATTAAAVAVMWMRPMVDDRLRRMATLGGAVLAIVALFATLSSGGKTDGRGAGATPTPPSSQGIGTWEPTPTPPPAATPAADQYADWGAAEGVLQSFFYYWQTNNFDNMLALTAPSWRNTQNDPAVALFTIQANRTPGGDLVVRRIDGSEGDTARTAKVEVSMSLNIAGRDPETYSFDVLMLKEDGQWYVDPRSLSTNVTVTATKAATNPMPTQPTLVEGYDSMTLYYNPQNGSYYHVDQNCPSTNERYLPLAGSFLYSELESDQYKGLKNCTRCGAPLREKDK